MLKLTNAIISDFDGKTLKATNSYQVKIYSRGNKTHLEGDMEFTVPLKTIVECFLAAGCQWFQLVKQEDGKWARVEIVGPK